MKRLSFFTAATAAAVFFLPQIAHAQGVADSIKGMHGVLERLFDEMIPKCDRLIDVARALAGFGATWYIAYRVWKHIANAEPIDFYPLFRPFALGLVIILYMPMLGLMNSVLKPTVTATQEMVEDSDKAIAALLKQKEEALKTTIEWKAYVGADGEGDRNEWYKYTHPGEDPDDEGFFEGIGNDVRFAMSKMYYNFKNSVKQWMSEVLQVLFQAASLCIDTLRTFQLIVLAMLGPLVLGFSVFDGFQTSLVSWLARYINIFLWLPVANLFGAIIGTIQENMLKLDLEQINDNGDTFFSATDTAYLIFMIIAIVGYFTVPTVAGYIVQSSGQNTMAQKINTILIGTPGGGGGMVGGVASRASQAAGNIAGIPGNIVQGYSGASAAHETGRSIGHGAGYLADKISGNKPDAKA
jgi:conjugative transposon TraJ protein